VKSDLKRNTLRGCTNMLVSPASVPDKAYPILIR
jgi:hypothetical protein